MCTRSHANGCGTSKRRQNAALKTRRDSDKDTAAQHDSSRYADGRRSSTVCRCDHVLCVFLDVYACCDATYRQRNACTAIGLMRSAQPKKKIGVRRKYRHRSTRHAALHVGPRARRAINRMQQLRTSQCHRLQPRDSLSQSDGKRLIAGGDIVDGGMRQRHPIASAACCCDGHCARELQRNSNGCTRPSARITSSVTNAVHRRTRSATANGAQENPSKNNSIAITNASSRPVLEG
ncbi:hypothetical protein NCPPB940_07960 [Xanthomonas hortorum pv. taraxaci]|nr:hypothetical protein NCPPB940_07960 [Xanthomonas hortorum pv. taraxaci]CAD0307346.1 hypothetical protein NCPPB940_07960 [Xanthomonas hortorum pv. taraxaci]